MTDLKRDITLGDKSVFLKKQKMLISITAKKG